MAAGRQTVNKLYNSILDTVLVYGLDENTRALNIDEEGVSNVSLRLSPQNELHLFCSHFSAAGSNGLHEGGGATLIKII